MENEIMVALLSLIGTLTGTFSGIVVSARKTNFRLEQLEKKVEKHNNLVERMAVAENNIKRLYRQRGSE